MKKFLLLTFGFEKPTPEIMAAWGEWFALLEDKIIEKGHLPRGKEISDAGTVDLPMGLESITGYVVIEAESFEAAEKLAAKNPYISSIRVYEIMGE